MHFSRFWWIVFYELTPLPNGGKKGLVAGNPGLHVNKKCTFFFRYKGHVVIRCYSSRSEVNKFVGPSRRPERS